MTTLERRSNDLCLALGLIAAIAAVTCFVMHVRSYWNESASRHQVSTNASQSGFWKGTRRSLD